MVKFSTMIFPPTVILEETFWIMHEEYQPNYNWEDLVEKEFKKHIPWQETESDAPDGDADWNDENLSTSG